jgi:phosphate transport system permease protein
VKVRFDRQARRIWKDRTMSIAALACVVIALIPLGSILLTAGVQGIQAIGPGFFTKSVPPPCGIGSSEACTPGGIGNAIEGTLILVGLASLMAMPVGILAGIYLAEYGHNRLGRGVRFLVDVMLQIPSIVVGIFAYTLIFEASRAGLTSGRLVFSTISGAIALATIMVPIVARTSEEALKLVPNSTREAALALGLPKYRVITGVVLGTARSGLLTGALLGVARVAGETAPLIMTAFNSPYFFQGLDQPIAAMPFVIYTFGVSPYSNWQQLAWGAAFVLVLMMLGISVISRVALRGRFSLAEVAR